MAKVKWIYLSKLHTQDGRYLEILHKLSAIQGTMTSLTIKSLPLITSALRLPQRGQ